MILFLNLLPTIWPWLILITAQIVTLAGRTGLGLSFLAVFAGVAVITGLMSPLAAIFAGAGVLGASRLPQLTGWRAGVGHLALILWCLALGAHLVPGFNNLRVLDEVQSGPDSSAFTMFLNVDKPIVLFAVLLAWPAVLSTPTAVKRTPLLIGIGILPLLFVLGLSAGAVRPEFSLPPWWLVFAVSNLFLTCLTEEIFFRGYLQSAISSKLGTAVGITAASILFGLAHFAGGPALVAFATILGLGCALGYYATGRLWVPVAMHFGFNLVHLTLFTYPGPA